MVFCVAFPLAFFLSGGQAVDANRGRCDPQRFVSRYRYWLPCVFLHMDRLTVCATQTGRHAPLHFQCVPERSPGIMNPRGLQCCPKHPHGFAGDGCAISFTARHGHRASSASPHHPSGAGSKPAPPVRPVLFPTGTGATWLHVVGRGGAPCFGFSTSTLGAWRRPAT